MQNECLSPGCPGARIGTHHIFLYFTHCLASVHVSGIVRYAIAVILSRCGPSECVVVALSSLSPFLTHFFQAVSQQVVNEDFTNKMSSYQATVRRTRKI